MPWDGVQGQLAAAFVLCGFCGPPPLLLVCFFVCVLFFSLPAFRHLFHALCLRSSQVRAMMATTRARVSQDVIKLFSATATVCDSLQYFFSRMQASGHCWGFTDATASQYSSGCHPLVLSLGGGCDRHG